MNRRSFFQTILGVIGGVAAAFAKKDDFPKQSKIKGSSQNLIIFDEVEEIEPKEDTICYVPTNYTCSICPFSDSNCYECHYVHAATWIGGPPRNCKLINIYEQPLDKTEYSQD